MGKICLIYEFSYRGSATDGATLLSTFYVIYIKFEDDGVRSFLQFYLQ